MEKENIKQQEKEVAMVECPFCNAPIEAPAKADVIFTCPRCHKELITYDKSVKYPPKPTQSTLKPFNNNNPITNSTKSSNNMALVYCSECGKQISSNAPYCPSCGAPQNNHSTDNTEISLGYLLVSFLIPLIGIILCFISWNKDNGKAKSALIGTVVGVLFSIIIYSMI